DRPPAQNPSRRLQRRAGEPVLVAPADGGRAIEIRGLANPARPSASRTPHMSPSVDSKIAGDYGKVTGEPAEASDGNGPRPDGARWRIPRIPSAPLTGGDAPALDRLVAASAGVAEVGSGT